MNIILMLLLISLLIVVHEFGHYIAAKAFGVQVTRFALGMPFGPVLFRKRIGETEFLIHALFLGGYVTFPDDIEAEDTEGETQESLPKDSPRRFRNKAPWQQAVIIASGVIANVLFALFLVFVTALYYQKLPSGKAEVYIKDFIETTSNVRAAGIQANDRMVAVNGIKIDSPNKLIFMVKKSKFFDGLAPKEIVEKKFEQLKALNQLYKDSEVIPAGSIVVLPQSAPEKQLTVKEDVVIGLERYEPGEVELTQKEREIRDLAYEKQAITLKEGATLREIATAVSDSYKPLTLTVLRDGKELTFEGIYTDKEGRLGVGLEIKEIFIPTTSVKAAALSSYHYLVDKTSLMVKSLWQLATFKIPLKDLYGIVGVTKAGGEIIKHNGLLGGLLFTALISMSLALFNILPIPALDGGHLMFLFLEKISGRKINEQMLEKINAIFFMLLIGLLVLTIFNDIIFH